MGDLGVYDKYEFHVVYQLVSQFIAVELSSQYHDFVKDRLYTGRYGIHYRRSTQTALHRIVTGLCKMLAPILTFTADEAWEYIPGEKCDSVHQAKWEKEMIWTTSEEISEWLSLFNCRTMGVLPQLEVLRQDKLIGKSLEAKVVAKGSKESLAPILKWQKDFQELLGVSQLIIEADDTQGKTGITFHCSRVNLDRQKCERCWHWEIDIGKNAEHPTICGRCVEAVTQLSDPKT